jgi:hypothetical protein
MNSPTRPPTADELLADPVVQQALEKAWIDSLPNDPESRHEEGGWIYMDLEMGLLIVRRAMPSARAGIDLTNPPVASGLVVVGKFHTHPNPISEGWNPGPSASDLTFDEKHGVPDLIRSENGVHFSGPPSRRGGLGGGPGYPS